MGEYNMPNAIAYSNLFKYLQLLNDTEGALEYHHKSSKIFLRFSSNHPNVWVVHLSTAITYKQQGLIQ